MANEICFRTLHLEEPWSLETYRSIGGYQALERVLREQMDRGEIIEMLKEASLRGRGGAGFPTGVKWGFMPRDSDCEKYVVCNSDEGEPGTCKDRDIMRFNPHQFIEGMIIAGYAMNAAVGYNYLRGEYREPYRYMEAAVEEARQAGYLGDNILGSDFSFQLYNTLGLGAYICGEETALLDSLEGKRGLPRYKPPFPANAGLYGQPTTVNNTETFASVPVILEKGAEWFLNLGKPNNGGCKIFSVSGDVNKPGNYEVPLGTPFSELLEMAGGVRDGKQLKAVIPGGTSMPVLPADIIMNTDMDYDALMEAGSAIGSGGVIVMDEDTCMVNTFERIMKFYMHESCGQCTPCREGSGWVWRFFDAIKRGHATLDDLDSLARVAKNIEGRTICAFGEAIAWPVAAVLKHFRHEFEYMIEHGHSIVESQQQAV